jgi:predicted hydrolase (HD superfamily)
MPICDKRQLLDLKAQGTTIVAPQQGLNNVPDGLANAANIDVNQYPNAQFFQLLIVGKSSIIIIIESDAIDFAKQWIEESLDRNDYRVLLEYSVYEVVFEDILNHSSMLKHPFAAKLDYASKIINQLGGTIKFSASDRQSQVQVEYKTNITGDVRNEHLDNIEDFSSTVEHLFQATSFVTGFGFSLVTKHISEPETMWRAGRPERRVDFDECSIQPVFNNLSKCNLQSLMVETMAKMNSITSHRAQLVYGYESIISALNSQIQREMIAAFNLDKKRKKTFKSELKEWIKTWLDNNKVEYNQARLELIQQPSSELLNRSLVSKKLAIHRVLKKYLGEREDLTQRLDLLHSMRINYSHDKDEEFTASDCSSSLDLLRETIMAIYKQR